MHKQSFIEYHELYDAWINYERHSMKIHAFPEEAVYRQIRETNPKYQNNITDALFRFWDWISVFIPEQKYNIYESSEILEHLSKLSESHINAYNEIKLKLQTGVSIQPYQRHLAEPLQVKFNYIYTHWNIRHLHLSCLQKSQKTVKTSGYILFVRIEGMSAYLIDVTKHTKECLEFHDTELLKIINNNWSHLLQKTHLTVSSQSQPTDPKDLKMLRNNSWNIIHNVNGKAILPYFGVNAAGGKNDTIGRYNTVIRILDNLEKTINSNYPFPKKVANKVLCVILCGQGSGIVIFDNHSDMRAFVIICKIYKDDTNSINAESKVLQKLFPDLLKSTAAEIRTKLFTNAYVLLYIGADNPNIFYAMELN